MERWRMRDPFYVVARMEAQEIAHDRKLIGDDMGQKLQSVSGQIQSDMHQWADWARRPQFWSNLNITPFFKLMGMRFGGDSPDFRLDPQSMAIHKSVMALDDKYKIVVAAYYVAKVWHEDMPELFNARGISRATYYRRLEAGTTMAHNQAMRMLRKQ